MTLNFNTLCNIFLLIFTMIGMHLLTFMPIGSGLYIISNIFGWAIVGGIIGLGFCEISKSSQVIYSKFLLYVALGFAFLIFPLMYQDTSILNFTPRFLALIGAFMYLFILYQLKTNDGASKDAILYVFLVGIIIESTIGLLQMFFFSIWDLQAGYYQLLNGRPAGTFRQPNVMASFMATGVILSLYLIPKADKNSSFKRFMLLYAIFSCSLVLMALQSRAGYLGFFFSLLLLILNLKQNFSVYKKPLIALISGVGLGLFSINLLAHTEVRASEIYTDGGIRKEIYQVSTDMLGENLLKGVGYGNFEKSFREKAVLTHQNSLESLENLDHPHNEFLFWAIEGGMVAIVGSLILVIGFLSIFNWKISTQDLTYISLIIPILIHTQLEFPFYISIGHLLLFLTLLWYIDSEKTHVKIYYLSAPKLFQVVGAGVSICILIFMISGFFTALKINKLVHDKSEKLYEYNHVLNPMIWQNFIERVNYDVYFNKGMQEGNINILNTYITSSLEYVNEYPRAKIYDKILQSISKIESLGYKVDKEVKSKAYKDAKRLYPYIFKYQIN